MFHNLPPLISIDACPIQAEVGALHPKKTPSQSGPPGIIKESVTLLLHRYGQGDEAALHQLVGMVYDELKATARRYLEKEPKATLTSTALVHEVYLRLVRGGVSFRDRSEFFFFAGHLMRQVLVDLARRRLTRKRGASLIFFTLDDAAEAIAGKVLDCESLLALDKALDELSRLDPRQGQIVALRFFAGFGVEEIADCLQLSPTTVKREWRTAKLWLGKALRRQINP